MFMAQPLHIKSMHYLRALHLAKQQVLHQVK